MEKVCFEVKKSQVFQIFFRVLAILKVMIQPFINVVESSLVLFLLAKTFGSIVKLYTLESDAKKKSDISPIVLSTILQVRSKWSEY